MTNMKTRPMEDTMWDHNRGVLHQASHTQTGFLDNGLNVGPRPPQNYARQNKRQPSPEIGRPSEFRHEYDMDENGALFFPWLGWQKENVAEPPRYFPSCRFRLFCWHGQS